MVHLPPRALLFVPGHRESMVVKASALPADAIVLDLEDSVPPGEKSAARTRITTALAAWPADAPRPFVRINAPRAGMLADDLPVALSHPAAGIVVPKVDLPVELAAVIESAAGRDVIVNVETPRALLHAEELADLPGVTGLFLGGEDLTNALGARRTPEGGELAWPRFAVLLAARAAGIAAYDTICPEFRNMEVLRRDCVAAAALGYDGKFAIHPAQLPIIIAAFTPSEEELERARRIVAAYDEAIARGEGAVAVDGQMVDPPVAERARAVLRRARRTT